MAKAMCKYEDDDGPCDRAAYCKGWCSKHYERWRRHGDPGKVIHPRRAPRLKPADVDAEAKACSICKRRLPLSAFRRRAGTPDGLRYDCKDCCRDRENKRYAGDAGYRKHRAELRSKEYRGDAERRKERERNRSFSKYGLTPEGFQARAEAQGGVCAICKKPPYGGRADSRKKRLSVDHDHETRIVRGLLCDPCNVALGLFRDSPELLATAIRYLEAAQPTGQLPLFAA